MGLDATDLSTPKAPEVRNDWLGRLLMRLLPSLG